MTLIQANETLPEMSEFDKGYVLGMAESKAKEKQTKEELT